MPTESDNERASRKAIGHPLSCHICPYNGRRDDEAQAACIACPGTDELSHAGKGHVSLDAFKSGLPPGVIAGINDRPKPIPDNAKITIDAGTLAGILYTLADMGRKQYLFCTGFCKA